MRSRTSLPVLIALVLVGCASPGAKEAGSTAPGPQFYPEPPAPPRLQFLTSFADATANQTQKSTFSQWLVGSATKSNGGEGQIESPYGIAARDGKNYVCDVARDRVHVIDFVNHTYATLGNSTLLSNPVNIVIAADGTKYICDTGRRVVVVFDANDQYVRDLGDPRACTPMASAMTDTAFYVCDIRDCEVEVWSRDGVYQRAISRKGPGPDELSNPTNIAVGPDGYLYVTDSLQQIIKVLDPNGNLRSTIGGRGANIGFFARPKGIAIDAQNDVIYVADAQWDVVQMFNTAGNLLMLFGKPGAEPSSMGLPAGIALDATSIDSFRQYLAPQFEPQYLLFLTNQFGKNKVAVYAFGRDRTLGEAAYQVDMARVQQLREQRRQEMEQEQRQRQR